MPQIDNLVNKYGKMAGWNSAKFNLFGRDVEGILAFGYDDETETESVYGAGKMPIGIGEGNYKANVTVEIYKEEINAILKVIPKGKRLSDAIAQDVIVQYEYEGKVITDIIRNFKIVGLGSEAKQGDKVVGQKIKAFCTHIDWNV